MPIPLSSVQFSCSVLSDSLWLHELQHARPPCPSPTLGVHSDSRPSSQWCHPAISSSVVPFSSYPQSLPASDPKCFPRPSRSHMAWPQCPLTSSSIALPSSSTAVTGAPQAPLWTHQIKASGPSHWLFFCFEGSSFRLCQGLSSHLRSLLMSQLFKEASSDQPQTITFHSLTQTYIPFQCPLLPPNISQICLLPPPVGKAHRTVHKCVSSFSAASPEPTSLPDTWQMFSKHLSKRKVRRKGKRTEDSEGILKIMNTEYHIYSPTKQPIESLPFLENLTCPLSISR